MQVRRGYRFFREGGYGDQGNTAAIDEEAAPEEARVAYVGSIREGAADRDAQRDNGPRFEAGSGSKARSRTQAGAWPEAASGMRGVR